jgi:hypothetical protein
MLSGSALRQSNPRILICRLAGKSALTPLTLDGTPLPADTMITLEMGSPVTRSRGLARARPRPA